MAQDALETLFLPLIFAVLGSTYSFHRFPERRPSLLLNLISFQLLGAVMFRQQPSLGLLGLMSVYSLCVLCLLVMHLQTPQGEKVTVKVPRR